MTIGVSGIFLAMVNNVFGGNSFEISNALQACVCGAGQQETPSGGDGVSR
jgi:hypothetical protein